MPRTKGSCANGWSAGCRKTTTKRASSLRFVAGCCGSAAYHRLALQDDLEPSVVYYKWLKKAWAKYGDMKEIIGISLQRQVLGTVWS